MGLEVDSDTYTPGTPLKVTMNLLQVSEWGKMFVTATPDHAGSWSGLAEKVVMPLECYKPADAVRHKVTDKKTDGEPVVMTWTPDKDYGEVVFTATITQGAGSKAGLRLLQIKSAPITAKVGTRSSSNISKNNNFVFVLAVLFAMFYYLK